MGKAWQGMAVDGMEHRTAAVACGGMGLPVAHPQGPVVAFYSLCPRLVPMEQRRCEGGRAVEERGVAVGQTRVLPSPFARTAAMYARYLTTYDLPMHSGTRSLRPP